MTVVRRPKFQISLMTFLVAVTAFAIGFTSRNALDGYHATYMGLTVPSSSSPVIVGEVLVIECDVNKNLDREVVVLSDNVIEMPLLGIVDVDGQSPNAIQQKMNKQFAKMGASNVELRVYRSTSQYRN